MVSGYEEQDSVFSVKRGKIHQPKLMGEQLCKLMDSEGGVPSNRNSVSVLSIIFCPNTVLRD